MTRTITRDAKRWVIKIGSALLTNDGAGLDRQAIDGWVEQIAQLLAKGNEVVLVSSGAIAEGIVRLGWTTRPESIHELQAAAAVGQMGLIQAYESSFKRYDRHTAQILLDHDDLASRQRYLNARGALQTLIGLNVVPIVNENDTVVTDEIRFGDNDSLAALVANLIDADMLVILTDKDGLYDANPDNNPNAQLVSEAMADDSSLDALAGGSSGSLGRGGMITKLQAARLAARSGCSTVIAGGRNQQILHQVAAGENVGTLLSASQKPLAARKQWLAGQLQVKGKLILDAGAVKVLTEQGRSLLAVGVSAVQGKFTRGELVSCMDSHGVEIARGLVNYNSDEANRIKGQSTEAIPKILGYRDDDELIHRDNLVISR
ncbi:MAG: glutamate 5-kinase [Porticoccaceae bacterium]|jgi:glutamate 5-kinase|nr:glutamate 5-kinase [Porticoccaceae bacterium]MBT6318613.1 glutamate 5-kinase [Porticoccaceae bacterium]MBT7905409.1 glutamate 5-kinase [Porticoccaceae bacterium]MDA9565918.1 glutamate 5-kinase [Porticoccaceae bacterium]MDB2554236.1 glutamate 5-kinase [Porticoccaceae bacterium]